MEEVFYALFSYFTVVINGVFYDTGNGVYCANIAHFATKFGGLFDDTWSLLFYPLFILFIIVFVAVFGATTGRDKYDIDVILFYFYPQ